MKKAVLTFSIALFLLHFTINIANGQEQPQPNKDTVNMDTDAKPQIYYPVEDENSGAGKKNSVATIAIIAGAVAVAGVASFFLLNRKKKK